MSSLALLCACSASTQPVAERADGGVDASTAPCRWVAGALVDPVVETEAWVQILDVVARGEGAAMIVRHRPPGAASDVIDLRWLDALGRPLGAPSTLLTLASGESSASMVYDPERDALAAIVEAPSGCHFAVQRLSTRAVQVREVQPPTDGFSLAGCRSLLRTRDGYSYLAEQIRALWGVSQVNVDPTGRALRGVALPVSEDPRTVPYARVALATGEALLAWRASASSAESSLRFVRHALDASSFEPAVNLTEPRMAEALQLVALDDGALALFEAQIDTFPPVRAVAAHAIDRRGAPTGETALRTDLGLTYLGGLSGVFAHGDVLLTATIAGADTQPRYVVLPSRRDGSERGAAIEMPVPPFGSEAFPGRIVATPDGALWVASHGQGMTAFRRAVAVPLRCAP